jgi:hypothetical protein
MYHDWCCCQVNRCRIAKEGESKKPRLKYGSTEPFYLRRTIFISRPILAFFVHPTPYSAICYGEFDTEMQHF